MAKITGIGGVFLKCKGKGAALAAWYQKHLGMPLEDFGGQRDDFVLVGIAAIGAAAEVTGGLKVGLPCGAGGHEGLEIEAVLEGVDVGGERERRRGL